MKFSSNMNKNFQLHLEVLTAAPDLTLKVNDFEPYFKKTIKRLKKEPHLRSMMKGGLVQLTFIDDKAIRILNKTYRHKDKPTDVISLSYFEEETFPFPGGNLIGEIFISMDTAVSQAKDHDKTLLEELQFLFVHGLLHIFGYDHGTASERKIMFDLQDEILGTTMWRPLLD